MLTSTRGAQWGKRTTRGAQWGKRTIRSGKNFRLHNGMYFAEGIIIEFML
jgi:hypothetical protein